MTDIFVHEDGSTTQIVLDTDGEHANPRHNDGCVATLVNLGSRTIDIDDDAEGLRDVRDHFYDYGPNHGGPRPGWKRPGVGTEDMVRRYCAMFKPEILYYTDHWSAGDSYGFGYVTREAWEKWMGADYDGDLTPEKAFDGEVRVYEQWANGEVYGYVHKGPETKCPTCHQDTTTEDSVWGFLGYKSSREIAEQASNSPIVEER